MKPPLCLSELTWVELAIQSKTSTRSAVNFKKQLTSVSSKLELAIWLRDTGQRISCFDRCQLIKTCPISKMSAVNSMILVTLAYMEGWTYVRTDGR